MENPPPLEGVGTYPFLNIWITVSAKFDAPELSSVSRRAFWVFLSCLGGFQVDIANLVEPWEGFLAFSSSDTIQRVVEYFHDCLDLVGSSFFLNTAL